MESRHFLLATIDAGGTVPPALGVAADLVRRGHRVRVLADPTVEPSARSAGCSFVSWSEAPHFESLEDQTAAIAAFEHGGPRQRLHLALRFASGAATRGNVNDVLTATRSQAPDGLLVESALPGILMGAEASRLPCAALVPNLYIRPTRGRPPLMTAWFPGVGPLGRLRDALSLQLLRLVTRSLARPLASIRAEYGLAPVADLFEPQDRLDRVLVLSSVHFDFPAQLPANVRYVGPQLDDPDWAASGEDWRPPGDDPLVLVALSSVYQRQTRVLRAISTALEAMPVRAVITTGRVVRPDEVPAAAHVRVVRSAPHHDVLREAAAVVTHAGHGTVMKALAAGVPLVCIPMGRDQRANTARVLWLGAGVQVGARSVGAIAGAIDRVLRDPTFAARATRVARLLADEAASSPNAADEIEAMVEARPAQGGRSGVGTVECGGRR